MRLQARSSDGTIRIWDRLNGTELATLTGHTDVVNAVAIAPQGAWLATAGSDGKVRIWEVSSGMCRALMRLEREATACCWLPDGRSIAVAGQAGMYLFNFHP